MDWKSVTSQILDSLDFIKEYEALGVKFAAKKPTGKGYVACFSYGRDDKRPSAAVCITGKSRGRYVCRATGLNLSFFDFCARFHGNRFPDWKSARDHFAKAANIKIEAPKKEPKRKWPEEHLIPLRWSNASARIFSERKKGVTPESLSIVGAFFARWPRKAPHNLAHTVVCIPAYGPYGLSRKPVGVVMANALGGRIAIYRGKDVSPDLVKVACVSGTEPGILNKHALANLSTASIMWKVEGFSDLLTLQANIPPTHLKDHIVITNTGGAVEYPNRDLLSMLFEKFNGKFFSVGDADEPGQLGARQWAEAAASYGKFAGTVQLPYEVAEKSGKDLRDFFNEGHTYQELLDSAHGVAPLPKGQEIEINGHTHESDFIENRLKCSVLGEGQDDEIEAYSKFHKKLFTIRNVNYFSYANLIQACGQPAQDCVSESTREIPAGKVTMGFVRVAFSKVAGGKPFKPKMKMGCGCWKIEGSDDILIIDGGSAATWNGSSFTALDEPKLGNYILDFSSSDPWCNFDLLSKLINKTNKTSARQVFESAEDVFRQWNWRHPNDASVLASLICCSWLQTLWSWRPLVAIPAASDSGKTTLFKTISSMFLGEKFCISINRPTEASIRQTVRNTAKILLIDEFESDHNRQRVMELLRTSSQGGTVSRGTPGQKAQHYGLKHIVYIAATETGLKREPDRNRFIELDCLRPRKSKRGILELPTSEELGSMGMELLAVTIKNFNRAAELAEILKVHRIKDVPGRVIESYSVPAAMLAAIRGEDTKTARLTLEWMLEGKFTQQKHEYDEEELLRDIVQSQVPTGNGHTMLVSEILSDQVNRASHSDSLERHGISLISQRQGPKNPGSATHVFFMPAMIHRYLLSRSTRWANDVDTTQVLLRFRGASRAQRTIMGKRSWGIEVPLDRIVTETESGILNIGDE